MSVEIHDNSKEISENIKSALLRGMEKCGLKAERFAKKLAPYDTGNLRNSITHEVDDGEPAVYIGTDVEYAPEQELGTMRIKAHPYLKPAVADHANEFQKIIENELKNG